MAVAVASIAFPLCVAPPPEFKDLSCPPWWYPPKKPKNPLEYNGLSDMKPACFKLNGGDDRPHSVYVIGDWGGVLYGGSWVAPADHRSSQFKGHSRAFIKGADDFAQHKVADAMMDHAAVDRVDYILNVGDNFYWGGISATCGNFDKFEGGPQWTHIYENMYHGPLDTVQWLSVLGNHDWGGWHYLAAWDQTIGYTWGAPGSKWRWFQPALYYKTRAIYEQTDPDHHEKGFMVDYFFVDTNMFDAFDPEKDPMHNICGTSHNHKYQGCNVTGPANPGECKWWFISIWKRQCSWLAEQLEASNLASDWQIVVTHFPPLWGMDFWQPISKKYGIDMMITGHTHHQDFWPQWGRNPLGGTAVIVSGGGGGITSEGLPNEHGWDDEYGFMKLELHKEQIIVRMVSHGKQLRREERVYPILPSYKLPDMKKSQQFMPTIEAGDAEVNPAHERIKEATKTEKVDNLLAQLEEQRKAMMHEKRRLDELRLDEPSQLV